LGEQLLRYVIGRIKGRKRKDRARLGLLDLFLEGCEDRPLVLDAFRRLALC
jgi:hypothetical protein